VRFNGTIRINGREVSPRDLARLVTQLETAAQKDEVNITEYVKDSRVVE
jgi:folylpolyglutamate synthase/dihydropteroate synthase